MDIHHLRIFTAVFRNRSFSGASREMGLSQPTVTEHIKNIETELGLRLFDRLGRSIIPTAEAETLYAHSLKIIDDMRLMEDAVRNASGNIRGEISIGASTIPGTYILPALAAEFGKAHPDISFNIVIDDSRRITDMVIAHDLMMGIAGSVLEPDKLMYEPFARDSLVLVARPGLVASNSVGINDLVSLPFILREEGSGTRNATEKFLNANEIAIASLRVVAKLGSTAAVKEAVKAGLGVSIISNLAVKDSVAHGDLVEIPISGATISRAFHLITHRKRTMPAHYNLFLKFLAGTSAVELAD